MDKNKSLKALLPLLILIAIFVWVRALAPRSKGGPREPQKKISMASYENKLPFFGDVQKRERKRSSYPTWGRNPFTIKETSDKRAIFKLSLEGIIWDEENPAAIINGQIVSVGDKISGNTITAIKENSVILNSGIASFELRL